MGIRMWEAKQFTPRRIELELDRTSDDWDLILTPAPEMDEHYRAEYRYDGEIHSAGYPRDDVLVSATRSGSGKRPATGWASADGPDGGALRADLARRPGHNYRSRQLVAPPRPRVRQRGAWDPSTCSSCAGTASTPGDAERSERTARLIDVTDYPEINDLILASDAAVLDYSSLRFDFALTGRPMVFLVPDLASTPAASAGSSTTSPTPRPGRCSTRPTRWSRRSGTCRGGGALRRGLPTAFNAKYNYLQDGRAAERVVRAFFG